MKHFVCLLTTLFLVAAVLLTGCSNKDTLAAKAVACDYLQAMIDEDSETAYSLLTNDDKKLIPLSVFIDFNETQSQTATLLSYVIKKEKKYPNYVSKNGIQYENSVAFDIIFKNKSLHDNKEREITGYVFIVEEDGKWKYSSDFTHESFTENHALAYYNLALMYLQGNGKSFDPLEAIEVTKRGMKMVPNHPELHITLGLAYLALDNYDKGRACFFDCIENARDDQNVVKSEAYNEIGNSYYLKYDNKNARKYYDLALKLDPNNEDAKLNIPLLEE